MKKVLLSLLSVYSFSIFSADFDLPKKLSWTAYDTGGSSYNQSIAIGAALKNEAGINLRVLPGKSDISRLQPLKMGRVDFSATGISGAYLAQEGVFEFTSPDWGPQPLRLLLSNNSGQTGIGLGVSEKSGIKTLDQLKGKRVAYVEGAPAVNVGIEGYLAYADLTWDDVEIVRYGGYTAAWRGFIAGEVDAMLSSTNSGSVYEAASGPYGLHWPEVDPNNTEGVERFFNVVPYLYTNIATVGANIDESKPLRTVTYPLPVLVALQSVDSEHAYNMTKALVDLFPAYDGKVQGISGWAFEKQNFVNNAVPYHDGAIKYFKERGVWSDEAQQHHDMLIARQQTLKKAWDKLKQDNPKDFTEEWIKAREKALKEGGFKVTFAEK